ncbi:MAG: DNA adenine methylase [Chloroflexota bacterium]|nr:DNA adenine methylase [Chloroflexota bacterium]
MHQLTLINVDDIQTVVNVASVPQRSPFRYPGGKTWLIPQVKRWLFSMGTKPRLLVEPFAGGGIVGLTAAFEELVERVVLVERDEQVASVWRAILGGDADWLANRIMNFEMCHETLETELGKGGGPIREMAFRTLLRNRTNHGGIMAPGAGLIKYGENGKGISSRWYPRTLAKRIREIGRIRSKIEFIQGDGLDVIREHACESETAFFIDPPYTAAGKKAGRRLYTYNEIDHEGLFTLTESVRGKFLMTYDDAKGVRDMAARHGFFVETVAMSNTHHTKMQELLISKDLAWVR